MPFVHSKKSVFSLDDAAGTLRNLTAYVDNVSGLPGTKALISVTALGDEGEKSIKGTENITFSISGHYDGTATTGPIAVLNGLRTVETTATFEYGPEGSTTGKIKFSGECWLSEYEVTSGVGEKVSFTASFQVDGTVTLGAYA